MPWVCLPLHRGRVRVLASVHHRARPARTGVGAAKRCADLVRATPHQPAAAFGRSYVPAAGTDRGSALSIIRAARFSYVTELYLIFYPASPRGIILAILVTGGAGFIGSHTCVELLRRGHEVIVADDHSNSSPAALAAIRDVSGGDLIAYQADMRDQQEMEQIFAENQINAVIHFAARKSVRESVEIPLDYYDSNVGCTISLLHMMLKHDVKQLVFRRHALSTEAGTAGR